MAISNATRLSDFGSGIGTSVPEYTLDVKGTLNATTLGLTNLNVTGIASIGTGVTVYGAGIVSATSFTGSGADLTGVSGFGTALDSTQGTLGNLVYKTPRNFVMSGVASVYLNSDTTSGGMLFTRLGGITVGGASTLHIGSGTTLAMDVLKLF